MIRILVGSSSIRPVMKKVASVFIVALVFLGRLPAQETLPQLGRSSIDEVISAMTLDENSGLLMDDKV